MNLNLSKEWFEKNIPDEPYEVGVGVPHRIEDQSVLAPVSREDDFVESYAFGALVQLLRRDRRLSVDDLAAAVQVAAPELLSIEFDPTYIPKPRTVFQLSQYFGLPDRPLLKLANLTTVHSNQLRDAAVRFAASSSKVMELSHEERAALADFVKVLVSEGAE